MKASGIQFENEVKFCLRHKTSIILCWLIRNSACAFCVSPAFSGDFLVSVVS